MTFTPTVTFRGLDRSEEALESEIHARVRKLARYYRSIMGCDVLVEFAQRRHAIGNHYHVRVGLAVPGEELVVAHDASLHATAQDTNTERGRKADEADPERKHARVTVGSQVSFVEEPGEKGPQASTVKLLNPRRSRHHAVRSH